MVLLGVVLILVAVLAGVLLVTGTASLEQPVDVELLFGTLSLPPLAFMITGMVVISLFWLGWAVLRGGLRRGKRLRAEAEAEAAAAESRRIAEEKRLQAEVATRDQQLAEERRLHEQETAALRQQTPPAPEQPRTPRKSFDDQR